MHFDSCVVEEEVASSLHIPPSPPSENPVQRFSFGNEETPRPAKGPRRKAGTRAESGVSELPL